MIFTNYKVVNIPQTNSESGTVVYTTTALCMLFFIPIGSRMEDDTEVRLYINNYFTDTDGGQADLHLYNSQASTSSPLDLNRLTHNHNSMVMCPSGKSIVARVGDNSDRIGGTLYVFELPNQP